MRPRVILHNAVSADGRTTGLDTNVGLFRRLASGWQADVTLAGSDTVLAALQTSHESEATPPTVPGGRLAVVDSRGRVKDWRTIKSWPYWSEFVSIGAGITPRNHLSYLRYVDVDQVSAGDRQVDLKDALEQLSQRYSATIVRVASGGTLNAALLRQGLVDEVSLLLHPVLVGGMSPRTVYRSVEMAHEAPIEMKLSDFQLLEGEYAWLRYEVVR